MVTKGKSGMVDLVCRFHHISSRGDKGKFLSGGASDRASPWESKGGEARVGLHQGCYIREHEVSRGGEASDGALLPKM